MASDPFSQIDAHLALFLRFVFSYAYLHTGLCSLSRFQLIYEYKSGRGIKKAHFRNVQLFELVFEADFLTCTRSPCPHSPGVCKGFPTGLLDKASREPLTTYAHTAGVAPRDFDEFGLGEIFRFGRSFAAVVPERKNRCLHPQAFIALPAELPRPSETLSENTHQGETRPKSLFFFCRARLIIAGRVPAIYIYMCIMAGKPLVFCQ